jgi:hypothetical protein
VQPQPQQQFQVETTTPSTIQQPSISSSPPASNQQSLEEERSRKDWKVNELKAELKKRSLPVSGSKSQLIERLNLSNKTDSKSVIQQRIQMRIQAQIHKQQQQALLQQQQNATAATAAATSEQTRLNKTERGVSSS